MEIYWTLKAQDDPERVYRFGEYEVHYEVREECIYIVDIWHTRENR